MRRKREYKFKRNFRRIKTQGDTMKQLLIVLALLLSGAAHADNHYVPIPDGFYSGTGTWTDNLGGHGTWSMVQQTSKAGLHHEFTAQFSDGRQYSGAVDEIFSPGSHFIYVTNVNGQSVTVGGGVSSPKEYQMSLALGTTETAMEFGYLDSRGNYERRTSITDTLSNRTTFMIITLKKSR
jgi:hypothetical protein